MTFTLVVSLSTGSRYSIDSENDAEQYIAKLDNPYSTEINENSSDGKNRLNDLFEDKLHY